MLLFGQAEHRSLRHHRLRHSRFCDQLSETQKAELQEIIRSLKDQNADRQTIESAVHKKFDEWGIERPERNGFHTRLNEQLTDAQRESLQSLIDELRVKDASRSEIREAMHEKLNEWGIQPHRPRILERLGNQLTETQKTELENLIKELKLQDASHREIRNAVHEKLSSWGIQSRPPKPENREKRQLLMKNQRQNLQGRVRPNPFNPDTNILYEIYEPADVKILIFNAQGQEIRSFIMGFQSAGSYQIKWDGCTESGESAPSGSYLYRIYAGNQSISGHMLLMK